MSIDPPDPVSAVRHMLSTILAAQKALRALAPQFRWSGLGNVLGDYGEFVAIQHYGLLKAPSGSSGFDAVNTDGEKISIKANYAAKQIGLRGDADLLLVVGIDDDAKWREIYFGDYATVKNQARRSERDNKWMIAVTKLEKLNET